MLRRNPKPSKSIEDYGYHFVKEPHGQGVITVLRNKKTGQRFSGNEQRYEELIKPVIEYVHDFLENNLKLEKMSIPVDAGPKDPKGFFFMSKNALETDKMMILVQGGGGVRAGLWSRSLIIKESFESGTMVPYIERATQEGFGVIITNGNHNKDSNNRPIKGSVTPQDHFVYVWNTFIKRAKARHIVIVAHSFGGEVVLHGLRNIEEAMERIKAVAFTHSIHTISSSESNSIKRWIKERSRNWVCSEKPLDTPVRLNSEDDCDQLSAGTTEHIWASHYAKDSVFNYFKEQLKADERMEAKPSKIIEDLGYHFVKEYDGQSVITVLRNKRTGRRFELDTDGGDNSKEKELYEAVKEYVHDIIENKLKLEKMSIPVDAGPEDPKGFFFMSKNALETNKMMILVQGSGGVRAGQWSRRLIINESFESGTMVPYIERATKEGFGVIITNGNHNKDSNNRSIKGSETPQDHFKYVWNTFIERAEARHIVIVAHSFGGEVVLHGLRNIEEAMERIKAVAFTHSIHTISSSESNSVKRWIKERSRNWVSSEKPLDTPVRLNSEDDCDQLSAGTTEHIWTSHYAKDSVFNFFKEQLKADERM